MTKWVPADMWVVIVMHLDGTVTEPVGPFWDEISARAWAERNPSRASMRYTVRQVLERGLWRAPK